MSKNNLVVVTIEEYPELTLEEICHDCGVSPEYVQELIEYAAVQPKQKTAELRFDADQIRRVKTILHLQHDLEVNLAGAALALDLMDEIKQMREQIELFEKHYFKSV